MFSSQSPRAQNINAHQVKLGYRLCQRLITIINAPVTLLNQAFYIKPIAIRWLPVSHILVYRNKERLTSKK